MTKCIRDHDFIDGSKFRISLGDTPPLYKGIESKLSAEYVDRVYILYNNNRRKREVDYTFRPVIRRHFDCALQGMVNPTKQQLRDVGDIPYPYIQKYSKEYCERDKISI